MALFSNILVKRTVKYIFTMYILEYNDGCNIYLLYYIVNLHLQKLKFRENNYTFHKKTNKSTIFNI